MQGIEVFISLTVKQLTCPLGNQPEQFSYFPLVCSIMSGLDT